MKTTPLIALAALAALSACAGFDREKFDADWARQEEARKAEQQAHANKVEQARQLAHKQARAKEWARVGETYGPEPTKAEIEATIAEVKANLKNPASFELVSVSPPQEVDLVTYESQTNPYKFDEEPNWKVSYKIGWGYLVKYRATNSYGGVVPGYASFVKRAVKDEQGANIHWVDEKKLARTLNAPTPGK